MTDHNWSRVFRVRDPRAAAVFVDPKSRRILMGFVRSPLSVGEATAAFNLNLKSLHYHVRRLVDFGLLVEVGKRPRDGRPIKLYRTVAKAFYVSGDLAPKLFGDDLSREMRECLERRASRTDTGIIFAASRAGAPRARTLVSERGPVAAIEMWRVLRLDPQEADGLRKELLGVLTRYERAASTNGGEVFLVHAALARRAEQGGLADND